MSVAARALELICDQRCLTKDVERAKFSTTTQESPAL